MSRPVYIYALHEPDQPWNIRYVGKTIQPLSTRLYRHIYCATRSKATHKNCWINGLLSRGLRPGIKIIDVGTDDTWEDLERFYIKSYKKAGYKLTNATDGGDGQSLGYKASPETCLKLSKCMKEIRASSTKWEGKRHSPEQQAKIVAANRGKKRTPEQCERIAASRRGISFSEEHRRNIALAQRGKPESPESIKKRSEALKGKPWSPARRAAYEASKGKVAA